MGERELREKYGGKLAKAINRAIRAEVPGGNEALDTLTKLAGAARHSEWTDRSGKDTAEAEAYFKHKRDVVDRMAAQVRQKWGVPPDREAGRERPPSRVGGPKRRAAPKRAVKARSSPRPAAKPRPRKPGRPRD